MDILERLLSYDAWTTRQYLALSESVADEPLDRPFDIGQGTLRQTWLHLIGNMETWTALMRGRRRAVPHLGRSTSNGAVARAFRGDRARIRRLRARGRRRWPSG